MMPDQRYRYGICYPDSHALHKAQLEEGVGKWRRVHVKVFDYDKGLTWSDDLVRTRVSQAHGMLDCDQGDVTSRLFLRYVPWDAARPYVDGQSWQPAIERYVAFWQSLPATIRSAAVPIFGNANGRNWKADPADQWMAEAEAYASLSEADPFAIPACGDDHDIAHVLKDWEVRERIWHEHAGRMPTYATFTGFGKRGWGVETAYDMSESWRVTAPHVTPVWAEVSRWFPRHGEGWASHPELLSYDTALWTRDTLIAAEANGLSPCLFDLDSVLLHGHQTPLGALLRGDSSAYPFGATSWASRRWSAPRARVAWNRYRLRRVAYRHQKRRLLT